MKAIFNTLFFVFFLFSFNMLSAQCEFETVGTAEYVSQNGQECIQLTVESPTQIGCAWLTKPFDFDFPIDYSMTAHFGSMDGGADGICMVFQMAADGLASCGENGGQIGAGGIENSLIIEFDTWQNPENGDPVEDHVAVNINGDMGFPIAPIAELGNIEDGQDHIVRFTWDPATMSFSVYFDGVEVTSGVFDVINFCLDGQSEAYFGFTGSTGAAFNNQLICPHLRESFHSFEICEGDSVVVNGETYFEGEYTQTLEIQNHCDSVVNISVTTIPVATDELFYILDEGESVEVNDVTYSTAGIYEQFFTASSGCDSVLIINVSQMQSIVSYNLDACIAIQDESNNDYSEFVPMYGEDFDCATLNASNVYRSNPDENRHSCTPGMNGTISMCVGALNDCEYQPDSDKTVKFEFEVIPEDGIAVTIQALKFFEKAPEEFNWIGGDSGPNNYPTLYGIKVYKNGANIFLSSNIPTTTDWSAETFYFNSIPAFTVTDSSVFSFELLPYCPVGNGAMKSAWDLEDINIMASCTPSDNIFADINGKVIANDGSALNDVLVVNHSLENEGDFIDTYTDENGAFRFEENLKGKPYLFTAEGGNDYMNGVSTYDIFLIQKHILGLDPFTNAYQFVAADVNNSGTVSAMDIIELRKLVLGYYNELPNVNSWRFFDANKPLDKQGPWNSEEFIKMDKLIEAHEDLTFIGCKIGDINQSASSYVNASSRSLNTVYIEIQDSNCNAGQDVTIDVKTFEDLKLNGFQFALDMANFQDVQVIPGKVDLDLANYFFNHGYLNISWSDIMEQEFMQGEILFTIKANCLTDGKMSEMMAISEEGFVNEGFSSDPQNLKRFELIISPKMIFSGNDHLALQSFPNPFSNSTSIVFNQEIEGPGYFAFYDVNGKLLYEEKRHFPKGTNIFELNKHDLNVTNGIILCQYNTGKAIGQIKMILTNH